MPELPDDQKISALQLGRIDTLVSDMHHRLFGNGQPGIVAAYDERLTELETLRHRFEGAIRFIKGAAVSLPVIFATGEAIRIWLKR